MTTSSLILSLYVLIFVSTCVVFKFCIFVAAGAIIETVVVTTVWVEKNLF